MAIRSRRAANDFERLLRQRTGPARGYKHRPRRRKLGRTQRDAALALAMIGLVIGWGVYDQRKQAVDAQRHPYPYSDCDAARADGASNFRLGDPRYTTRQDRDNDGVACEPYP